MTVEFPLLRLILYNISCSVQSKPVRDISFQKAHSAMQTIASFMSFAPKMQQPDEVTQQNKERNRWKGSINKEQKEGKGEKRREQKGQERQGKDKNERTRRDRVRKARKQRKRQGKGTN